MRSSFPQNYGSDTFPVVPFKPASLPTNIPASASESNGFSHSSQSIYGPPPFAPRGPAASTETLTGDISVVSSRWSESDFPPLHPISGQSGNFEQDVDSSSDDPHSDNGSEPLASQIGRAHV